jgi:hypothetical protein
MSSGGSVDIDDSELEGLTDDEKEDLINEYVNRAAYEEVDSSLDWGISEAE